MFTRHIIPIGILAGLLVPAPPLQATIVYVDKDATGANDGTSWVDAATDLKLVLDGAGSGDSIWVAEGIHVPTAGSDRQAAFELANGVAIYGGFNGTETTLEERDPVLHVTTLSGDIGIPTDITDNSYHVVTADNAIDGTAVLDGFTIAHGNADGPYPDNSGGGILCIFNGSPTLADLVIRNNKAAASGGGMRNDDGSPQLIGVTFESNDATWGGGLSNDDGGMELTGVTFQSNAATNEGGGMKNSGDATLISVMFDGNISGGLGGGLSESGASTTLEGLTFIGNSAGTNGGGMFGGSDDGAVSNVVFRGNNASGQGGGLSLSATNPSLLNAEFFGNTAATGAALSVSAISNASLANITVHDNVATVAGGGLNSAGTVDLVNGIVWGNTAPTGPEVRNTGTATISHSIILGSGGSGGGWDPGLGTDAGGNLDVDPEFVSAGGGNLRLLLGSPAIDAGAGTVPGLPAIDLDGNSRNSGLTLDMGGYEYQFICPPGPVMYVDSSATGAADGTSWVDAFPSLENALLTAAGCPWVKEMWVARGTYLPTQGSDRRESFALQDSLAIYGGFSGTEISRSERDWTANPTVLSGDIGLSGTSSDNTYHVVTSGNTATDAAVLDGFTITGGRADGAGDDEGGGIRVSGPTAPTLRNLVVSDNEAVYGGGVHNTSADLVMSNVTFTDNIAGTLGGAVFNSPGGFSLTNGVFSANESFLGGGIYSDGSASSLDLVSVVFDQNVATAEGGGLYLDDGTVALANMLATANDANDGGVISIHGATVTIINSAFHLNSAAGFGGAVYNDENPIIVNSIFWNNNAAFGGPEIFNSGGGLPFISHSLIRGSGGSGAGWDVTLGIDGGNNLDADPQFVDAALGDFHLSAFSPAVNMGDNGAPGLPATDLDGNARINGQIVDMGPYETDLGLAIQSVVDVGNDQGRNVLINFSRSALDVPGSPRPILQYALYRRVDPLPSGASVTAGTASVAEAMVPGWVFAGSVPAFGETEYNAIAPTLADSTIADGMHWSVFFVRAATATPTVFYDSSPDSGYSLDNLAPAPPENLHFEWPVTLAWNEAPEPDFDYYTVYGSASPTFDGSAVLVGHTSTGTFDLYGLTHVFYFVTATDFSGNEGDPASTSEPLALDETPSARLLTLRVHPNPFTPLTTVRYTVPEAGLVTLALYDLAGRRVDILVDREYQGVNEYTVRYRPRLPSGVYFLSLDLGGKVTRQKVTVLN